MTTNQSRYQVLRRRRIFVKENHCQEHMKTIYRIYIYINICRILLIGGSWKERPVWHSIARYEVPPITTGNAPATKTLFPVQNARPANTQKQWRRLLFCKSHVIKYWLWLKPLSCQNPGCSWCPLPGSFFENVWMFIFPPPWKAFCFNLVCT